MPALIVAADVRRWLPGLTGTSEDTLLGVLAAMAEDYAARWCGLPEVSGACSFYATSYTIYTGDPGCFVSGDGRTIYLPLPALSAVSSVYDDPTEQWAAASLVSSADYQIRGNTIRLLKSSAHGAFSTEAGALKITCTAGYTTAPASLASAMAQIAAHMFRERHRMGQTNASEGGRSAGFADGWTETIRGLLSPFRAVIQ